MTAFDISLWSVMFALGLQFFVTGMICVFYPSKEKEELQQKHANNINASQAKGKG